MAFLSSFNLIPYSILIHNLILLLYVFCFWFLRFNLRDKHNRHDRHDRRDRERDNRNSPRVQGDDGWRTDRERRERNNRRRGRSSEERRESRDPEWMSEDTGNKPFKLGATVPERSQLELEQEAEIEAKMALKPLVPFFKSNTSTERAPGLSKPSPKQKEQSFNDAALQGALDLGSLEGSLAGLGKGSNGGGLSLFGGVGGIGGINTSIFGGDSWSSAQKKKAEGAEGGSRWGFANKKSSPVPNHSAGGDDDDIEGETFNIGGFGDFGFDEPQPAKDPAANAWNKPVVSAQPNKDEQPVRPISTSVSNFFAAMPPTATKPAPTATTGPGPALGQPPHFNKAQRPHPGHHTFPPQQQQQQQHQQPGNGAHGGQGQPHTGTNINVKDMFGMLAAQGNSQPLPPMPPMPPMPANAEGHHPHQHLPQQQQQTQPVQPSQNYQHLISQARARQRQPNQARDTARRAALAHGLQGQGQVQGKVPFKPQQGQGPPHQQYNPNQHGYPPLPNPQKHSPGHSYPFPQNPNQKGPQDQARATEGGGNAKPGSKINVTDMFGLMAQHASKLPPMPPMPYNHNDLGNQGKPGQHPHQHPHPHQQPHPQHGHHQHQHQHHRPPPNYNANNPNQPHPHNQHNRPPQGYRPNIPPNQFNHQNAHQNRPRAHPNGGWGGPNHPHGPPINPNMRGPGPNHQNHPHNMPPQMHMSHPQHLNRPPQNFNRPNNPLPPR